MHTQLIRFRALALVAAFLLLASTALAQFNPFQPSDPAELKAHVLKVAYMLAPNYRVEVQWDSPDIVIPNGCLMVGVPETQARVYRCLTLPTWASPEQIAGKLDNEVQFKLGTRKWYKPWQWFSSSKYVVRGNLGAYEVHEFSVPAQ